MSGESAPVQGPSDADRPRVAFFTRNLVIGGAERVFLNLVNNARRVDPFPVLLRRRGNLLSDVSQAHELHALDTRSTRDRLSADSIERMPFGSSALLLRECRNLRRLVDAHHVPLVTSFLMRSHLVALLVKIMFRPRLKVVLNIHEHMSESAAYLYPKRRDRAVARWVARTLFPHADRIVVVANEVRRDLISSFSFPGNLVQTIHNPVDLDRIRALAKQPVPSPFPERDNRPTICAVGRLVYLKGYDVLLHAVAALKRTLPVRLILVGDGEERATLEALVSRLDLGDDVRFVGWQANPWALLARSDVLALSSRTEAFPSVITEAMALDIPVAAAECSAGVRECVDDGSAGILVPPANPAALATALGTILTQPEVAESLRRRGAVYVARFRLHDAVATYEDMLLDVLGRGTREAAEHRSEFTPRKAADVAVDG